MTGGWPDRLERTLALGPEERVVRELVHENSLVRSAGVAGAAALVALVAGVAFGWLTLPFSAWWVAIGAVGFAGVSRVAMDRHTILTTERIVAQSRFRMREMALADIAEGRVTIGGIILVDHAGSRLRIGGLVDTPAASEELRRQGITMTEAPAASTWE